jgi:1-pyrroline-5-carboxylate dehydrogenase
MKKRFHQQSGFVTWPHLHSLSVYNSVYLQAKISQSLLSNHYIKYFTVMVKSTGPFKNETYLNFDDESIFSAQKAALQNVRENLGREYDMLIGGKRVKGKKGTFKRENPSNIKESVGTFQLASKKQAIKALDSAWEAFQTWQYVSPEKRADYLFRAADVVRRRRLEINAWAITEVGQNFGETDAQIAEAIDFLEYYAREAIRYGEGMDVTDSKGEKNRTIYIPLGAGISISPWNFPFAITIGMAAGPIAAGNTIVAKPSPDSPMMAHLVSEVFEEVGLPDGVFNLVTGDNIEVGETLVKSYKTRFINFTGSLAVGQRITRLAGKPHGKQHFIKRVSTELGGKNAVVVDSEADVNSTAQAIVTSAFGYQGQKCSAGSRAIICSDIYEDVVERVIALTENLQIGNAAENFAVGPVINKKAVEKIMRYIKAGKKDGKLVAGGKRVKLEDKGYYIQPTVFRDVPEDASIAQDEIFGPVVSIIKADDCDDALRIANSTRFGLTGAFFSKNPVKIEKALREFHVGNLYINRKSTGALVGAQPFGGFNLSGTDSKAGGRDYLLYFLQAKSLTESLQPGKKYVIDDFSHFNL